MANIPTIKVKVNASNNGIVVKPSFSAPDSPKNSIVIKNAASTISTGGRLDMLQDVVEGTMPTDGSTLVYNSSTDKYEVQKLNLSDTDGPLDGGEF